MQARTRSLVRLAVSLCAATALTPAASSVAYAQTTLPTGGVVGAGGAIIGTPTANALTITQSTDRAVVNWSTFNIGTGNTVTFSQPGTNAAILNRVAPGTTSTIAGTLTANGRVYLVNPNGIQITSSGLVDTRGGFVASTLDITDTDFMAGRDKFSGGGSGRVSNAGRIQTGDGGFVALLGATVRNSGTISVPLGKVGLASGKQVTLDINGDNFLTVALPADAPEGKVLIKNKGTIEANGGRVEIKAATVATAMREAIHIPGAIRAGSVGGVSGAVVLGGGPGGRVKVPSGGSIKVGTRGPFDANPPSRIDISGADISIGGRLEVEGETFGRIKLRSEGNIDIAGSIRNPGYGSGVISDPAPILDVHAKGDLTVSGSINTDRGVGSVDFLNEFGAIALVSDGTTTLTSTAVVSTMGRGGGGSVEIVGGNLLVVAGRIDALWAGEGWGPAVSLRGKEVRLQGAQVTASDIQIGYGRVVWRYEDESAPDPRAGGAEKVAIDAGTVLTAMQPFHLYTFENGVDPGPKVSIWGRDGVTFDGQVRTRHPDPSRPLDAWNFTVDLGTAGRLQHADGSLPFSVTGIDFSNVLGPAAPTFGGVPAAVLSVSAGNVVIAGFGDVASLPADPMGTRTVLPKDELETKLFSQRVDVTVSSALDLTWLGGTERRVRNGTAYEPMPEASHFGRLALIAGRDVTVTGSLDFRNTTGTRDGNLDVAAGLSGAGNATFTSGPGGRATIDLGAGFLGVTATNVVLDVNRIRAQGVGAEASDKVTFTGDVLTTGQQAYQGHLVFAPRHGRNDILLKSTEDGFGSSTMAIEWRNSTTSFMYGLGTVGMVDMYDGAERLLGYANFPAPQLGRNPLDNRAVHLGVGPMGGYGPGPLPGWPPRVTWSRRYGEAIPLLHVVEPGLHGGLRPGDTLDGIANGQISASDPNPVVGSTQVTFGLARTFTGPEGYFIDYRHTVQYANIWGGLDITTAPAVVSIDLTHRSATYTYGSPEWIVRINNLYSGDQLSPVVSLGGASTTLIGLATAEYGLPVRTNAGTYGYTITGLSGPSASNYTLDVTTPLTGSVTIARRELGATTREISHVYGDATSSFVSLSNLVDGDQVTPAGTLTGGGTLAAFGSTPGQYALAGRPNAGLYEFTLTGLGGAAAANYTLAPAAVNAVGKVTVDQRTLLFQDAAGRRRTYGEAGTGFALHNIIAGDAVRPIVNRGGTLETLAAEPNNIDFLFGDRVAAGTHSYSVVGLDGASAANYRLNGNQVLSGTYMVDQKALSYSGSFSKVYGDATPTSFGVTLSGVLSGDQVGAASFRIAATGGGSSFVPADRTDAGDYRLLATTLTGTSAANYVLGTSTATLTIDRRPITYSAPTVSLVYGDDLPAATGLTVNGVLPGDVVTLGSRLTPGTGTPTELLGGRYQAGQYAVDTSGTVGGASAGNYRFDPASGANAPGLATVTPKLLTLSTSATQSYRYGDLAFQNAAIAAGIVGSDNVSARVVNAQGGQFTQVNLEGSDVGSYAFTAALTGDHARNYAIPATGWTATITPRGLDFTFTGSPTQAFGNSLDLFGTLTGVLPQDAGRVMGGSFTANGAPVTVSTILDVGQYTVALNSLAGNRAFNYVLNAGSGTQSVQITPQQLAIVIRALNASTQYGMPFQVNYVVFDQSSGTAFDIQGATVSFEARHPSSGSAAALQRVSGLPDSYAVSLGAGTYTLIPTITGVSPNYAVVQQNGTLTIQKRILGLQNMDVPWSQLGRYGDNPTFGSEAQQNAYLVSQLMDGRPVERIKPNIGGLDHMLRAELAGDLAVKVSPFGSNAEAAIAPRMPAGDYRFRVSLKSDSNFTLLGFDSFSDKVLPRALSVPGAATTVYGTRPGAFTPTGVLAGDEVVGTIAQVVRNGQTSDPRSQAFHIDRGIYDVTGVTIGGRDASNYTIGNSGSGTIVSGSMVLTVDPKPITVTGLGSARQSSVYGDDWLAGGFRLDAFRGQFTYDGLVVGNDALFLTPTLSNAITAADGRTFVSGNIPSVGTYSRTVLGGTPLLGNPIISANYVLAPGGHAALPFTITPRPITFTTRSVTTTYGDTVAVDGSFTGVLDRDRAGIAGALFGLRRDGNPIGLLNATLVDQRMSSVLPVVPAGTYQYEIAGISGTAAGNYMLDAANSSRGTITVDQRALTYSTTGGFTYYAIGTVGSTLNDLGKVTLKGVLAGDDVQGFAGIRGYGSRTTNDGATGLPILYPGPGFGLDEMILPLRVVAPENPQAGHYDVVVAGLLGPAARNYKIATTRNEPGTLIVFDTGLLLRPEISGVSAANSTAGRFVAAIFRAQVEQALGSVQSANDNGSAATAAMTQVDRILKQRDELNRSMLVVPSIRIEKKVEKTPGVTNQEVDTGTTQSTYKADPNFDPNKTGVGKGKWNANGTADVMLEDCTGSVCNRTILSAGYNALFRYGITGTAGGAAGVGITNATSVEMTCGGSPCTFTHATTATVSAGAAIGYSKDGLGAVATYSLSVSDKVEFENSCGGKGTCTSFVQASAGYAGSYGVSLTRAGGLQAGATTGKGAAIAAGSSYEDEKGSVGGSAGVSVGGAGFQSRGRSDFQDGKFHFALGLDMQLGIGISFDLNFSVQIGNVTTTTYVLADPAAHKARMALLQKYEDEAQAMRQEQATFLSAVLTKDLGHMNHPEAIEQYLLRSVKQLDERKAALEKALKADGFDKIDWFKDGGLQVADPKKPDMKAVTTTSYGIFGF